MKSICPKCGNEYSHKPSHAPKYCSRRCYLESRLVQHKCLFCHKIFPVKLGQMRGRHKALFCSWACFTNSKKKWVVFWYKKLICPQCLREFISQKHLGPFLFCSKACANDYHGAPPRRYDNWERDDYIMRTLAGQLFGPGAYRKMDELRKKIVRIKVLEFKIKREVQNGQSELSQLQPR